MLPVFQFLLPMQTNAGGSYQNERAAFYHEAIRIAGGYTLMGQVEGAWKEGAKVYRDRSMAIHICCERATAQTLLDKAFVLFPDQEAIYVAQIGAGNAYAQGEVI